ncbi:polysaccharide biosynthesis C-terminal domain-containing protein [Rhodobacter sp. Har01]|uniref:MATE family efflux transporter n=1 Tax=Rhodobacter sp. Har01 TaxID=2883999 RepID=UPI001D071122|nr:MATE family efflux transporter [Rhodobacter sp. Har01]MCB6178217.1 polysaccharide biosynthesis C-terminal domain-containing protein [Rhodobacter sp. Har01]
MKGLGRVGGAQAKFVEGSLLRHIVVMSLTSSVGLMAIFVVDLINMVYIGWLKDPVLTAAVGYGGAVMFFVTAFGIGLSIGVSALVAQAVGARDPGLARERATAGLVLSLGFGSAFSALVWVLLPQIVGLLGATGRTAEETVHFLQVYTASQPLLILGIVGAAILRAFGEARRAMMVTVWAAVALAALDPVLILWARLDLTGAALAGAGSRIVMAGMALWPVWRRIGGFAPLDRRVLAGVLRPLSAISGPAILTQLATPVGQALVTRLVAGFGEAAVAGMAIAGRLTPVAFSVLFALAGALGPIIGQNLGAKRMDRVRQSFGDAIRFTGMVIVAVSAVLFALRAPLADMFHAEGVTRDLVYLFCGPLSLLFFFNGLIFVANATCNNLGAAYQSTLINWARHTLGTLPFALLGAQWWGAAGVLIGQAAGGVVFGLISAWLAWRVVLRRTAPAPAGV